VIVSCHWVDEHYDIHEDPLGLVQIPSCTVDSIVQQLKDVLIRCILPLKKCRGQGYDEAATMTGRLTAENCHVCQPYVPARFVTAHVIFGDACWPTLSDLRNCLSKYCTWSK
jgi:hypothetical protein